MRIHLGLLVGALALACGSSDDGNSGTGGAAGTGGASSGGASSGGASSGGASSGGGSVAVAGSGGSAGAAFVCLAKTDPFPTVDCAKTCQHFTDWGAGGACATPYAGDPQCPLACDTIIHSNPYVNALFGCAAQEAECSAYLKCFHGYCG
ncbi:MAG: hypothetical protein IPI67_33445 [Myxococcales bacterium]|nr:hypothetical protein [Myxococcales bacterium]